MKRRPGRQRFGIVVAMITVSFIVLGTPVAWPQTQIFYDDFESYAPGTFPGAGGWQLVYGGAGDGLQYIDTTTASSGVQSFHTVGSGCWASAIQEAVTVPSKVRFETKVYVDQIVGCGCTPSLGHMGLWKPAGPEMTAGRIHFGCDGNIYAETQTLGNLFIGVNLVLLTSYTAGTWYEVRVDYDYGLKTFDVYIDGTRRGESILILDDLTDRMPTSVVIGAHHGTNPVVWFDDVKVSDMSCTQPPSDIVSWWPGDGSAADIIGSNDGTLMNGATYAAGKVGQAFNFDGVDDAVHVAETSTVDGGLQATYMAWVRPSVVPETGAYFGVLGVGDSTLSTWDSQQCRMLYWHDSGNPDMARFYADCGINNADNWASRFTADEYPINNWYLVAATFNSGTMDLYVNGVLSNGAEKSLPGSQINTNAPRYAWIGAEVKESDLSIYVPFNGLIDEAAIFNRALSAEEIAAIYAAGSAGMCNPGTPDISIDPSEYDFGSVARGGSKLQTFTVSNNGSADLMIGGFTVDPMGHFAVLMVFDTCSNSTVASSASCTFVVQFSAYTAGVKNATLHIPSNDPDTGTLEVSLSGTSYYTLSVAATPADSGTVTGAGINCGGGNADCTEAITVHDQGVELTATPATGYAFVRWEGDASGTTNPVTVQMSDHKNVTALFATDRQVCPTCGLTSIQDALAAAQIGDTIKLMRDITYRENILIDTNKEVTVSGGWDSTFTTQTPDPFLTRIDGDADGDGFGDGSVVTVVAGTSERIRVILRNITIQNGYALTPGMQNGGGIRAIASDGGEIELSLEDAVVAGNRAEEEGGGLWAHADGGALAVGMSNTQVVDNEAMGGGGIEFFGEGVGGSGTLSLMNTTVSGNRADYNGGLYVGGHSSGVSTVDITNSILWGNRSRTDGGDITHYQYLGAATVNASYSDIGTVEPVPGYSGTYNGAPTNINFDPVFINPVLWDYRLHQDSPAIDAGIASGAPGFDFEGEVRDGSPDMGADEFVSPPPAMAIRLLSLNSGEIIDCGIPYDIIWEAPDAAQSFKVFYTLDNGLTWLKSKPADIDPAYFGHIVNEYRHYRWDVPVLTKNKKAKVKVVGYTGSNGTGAKAGTDITDVPVLLRTVQLLTPNGGETLTGSTYVVRWEATEGPKAPVAEVKLSYTTNNGVTWKTIETVTGNPGSYSWTLPQIVKPKTKCKVKVELRDGAGKIIGSDMSDSVFTLDLDR